MRTNKKPSVVQKYNEVLARRRPSVIKSQPEFSLCINCGGKTGLDNDYCSVHCQKEHEALRKF